MTRQEMNQLVMAKAGPQLKREIEHYLGIEEREYAYDPVFALFDVENAEGSSVSERFGARQLLIELGFYREMSEEEIANTFTSDGRVPWHFKINGKKYTTDETAEDWENAAIAWEAA